MPDEYQGTPMEAADRLKEQMQQLNGRIRAQEQEIFRTLNDRKEHLVNACRRLADFDKNFEIRRLPPVPRPTNIPITFSAAG